MSVRPRSGGSGGGRVGPWRCVLLLIACIGFAAVPLCAQDAPVSNPERGGDQFRKTCSFCHGATATGTPNGPNLILSTVLRHDKKGDQFAAFIRQGRPDKGMPAFNLGDAEISDLFAFLRARMAASDIRSANRPLGAYSLDKLLTGKPDVGKTFFFGAGKCFTCHSPTGDLAGISGKYPPTELQARMLYPRKEHETATITDGTGHEWKGTISLITNFDVAIRDSDGWYHSWALNSVKLRIDDPLAAHRNLLTRYTDSDMHNVFAYLESLK